MSSYTRYLRLVKPSIDEAYDINVFNNNFDKIDREFEEKIASDSFVSEDEDEPEELATMPEVMVDGDDRSTLFNKLSVVVKNVRYLIGLIGNTDISAIGDGSITGAINGVNEDLQTKVETINGDLTANNQIAGVSDVPFRFGCNDDGEYGYIINEGGADTVHPFKHNPTVSAISSSAVGNVQNPRIVSLSGYSSYLIVLQFYQAQSSVSASGCGASRIVYVPANNWGTLAIFLCTSSGTCTISSEQQVNNIAVIGIN